jgi:peptidoglycan hydrolase-like protein with peptidoglycan-binding domain
MTPQDIQAVAANAGFAGADLATAVAIALAETNPSGNENSYNPETQKATPAGQGSYGLWQIYLWKHPEFAGENLMDPQTNANAAYQLYAQHGFAPWSTYGSGKYQAYLGQAIAAVQAAALPMPSFATPTPLTLDAQTGLPIDTAAITPDIIFSSGPSPGPSFGEVMLWGALGLFALWIFSEAT